MNDWQRMAGDRLPRFEQLRHGEDGALRDDRIRERRSVGSDVPVFALCLLMDFDRLVTRFEQLVPRPWTAPVGDVAGQIQRIPSGYVQGHLTANYRRVAEKTKLATLSSAHSPRKGHALWAGIPRQEWVISSWVAQEARA